MGDGGEGVAQRKCDMKSQEDTNIPDLQETGRRSETKQTNTKKNIAFMSRVYLKTYTNITSNQPRLPSTRHVVKPPKVQTLAPSRRVGEVKMRGCLIVHN